MTKEEKIEAIRQRARKNFSLGYNCAECITDAVLTVLDTGLPPEVKKVATGFGGGVGLYGDTCGALTGAIIAVGCVHGRAKLPEDPDPKQAMKKAAAELYGKPGLYRLFNQLPNKFLEKYGCTCCRDLTTKWQSSWLCKEHALYCREIITDAAGMAAELIMTDRDEAASRPFGKNVEHLEETPEACDLSGKGT
ncbi:MAG: putative redox-active protein (C_GCAxxG_C_C) [Syntrophaceae bacterium PtaU1.Bin231]|nr:MAG: putative redox-active protein (C_GCAxxG_C_C) [Syntrophaceae bacterium PtaU1.Bin231]